MSNVILCDIGSKACYLYAADHDRGQRSIGRTDEMEGKRIDGLVFAIRRSDSDLNLCVAIRQETKGGICCLECIVEHGLNRRQLV